jgi:hypothetical protein
VQHGWQGANPDIQMGMRTNVIVETLKKVLPMFDTTGRVPPVLDLPQQVMAMLRAAFT